MLKQRKNIGNKSIEKILAVETTGSALSLALCEKGVVTAEYRSNQKIYHSEKLIPALEWLMRENDWVHPPDAVAVDIGPGSFTGIRVGIAMTRALALAWKVRLIGIKSLDAIALGAGVWKGRVVSLIDALRGEVFSAEYHKDASLHMTRKYRLLSINTLLKDLDTINEPVLCIGSGVLSHGDMIRKVLKKKAYIADVAYHVPSASCVALLAAEKVTRRKYDIEHVEPFYLRRPAVEERKK